ncbi:sugar kinase [Candidatus Paraburkholderia kirkii]|nr:sugar kinase [Candidatus Paraburkholderia kirkii]
MSEKHIICLGSALWDTIFRVDHIPPHGGKILPTVALQGASGMATVAAVSIARLGGRVSLWSRIGDDHTGQMFIEDLAREGVSTVGVRQLPNVRTPFSTILVDKHGERLVVPYFDPALDTDTRWLPLHEIAGAGAVLCDMRWLQGAEQLFSHARRLGIPTILDADVAPVDDLRAVIVVLQRPWRLPDASRRRVIRARYIANYHSASYQDEFTGRLHRFRIEKKGVEEARTENAGGQ